MEGLLQAVDGAVDDAAVKAEQEAADGGHAADQNDEAGVFRLLGGIGALESNAVHKGLLGLLLHRRHAPDEGLVTFHIIKQMALTSLLSLAGFRPCVNAIVVSIPPF
jgi:hypothetical protein